MFILMSRVLIFLINFYKKHISLFFKKNGVECKFYPTCSEYSLEAIKKYGSFKGTLLSIKRILKCNPFSKGGYDPLK
jgi:putative membrane protein insertion efficiency factor